MRISDKNGYRFVDTKIREYPIYDCGVRYEYDDTEMPREKLKNRRYFLLKGSYEPFIADKITRKYHRISQ